MGSRAMATCAAVFVLLLATWPCLADEPAAAPVIDGPPAASVAARPAAASASQAPPSASGAAGRAARDARGVRRQGATWSRKTSLAAIGGGAGLLGAGWLLSVLHGAFGEVFGVDCGTHDSGYGSALYCNDTRGYEGIYVPVVGPFLEASTHRGALSDADKGFLFLEGILQVSGAVTAVIGLATLPMAKAEPARVVLAPMITANGAGIGVTGSF